MSGTLLLLIVKIIAGIIAAFFTTKLTLLKEPTDSDGKIPVAKWSLSKTGLWTIVGLWIAFVLSLGSDIYKYRDDQAKDEKKKLEAKAAQEKLDLETKLNKKWQATLENRAISIKKDTTYSLSQIAEAKQSLKEAQDSLAQVRDEQNKAAREARKRLSQVRDEQNKAARRAKDTLSEVNRAARTGSRTLQGVSMANRNLNASIEVLTGVAKQQKEAVKTATVTLENLNKTHREVLRAAQPLRPQNMVLHVQYPYQQTSSGFQLFSKNIRDWINEWESTRPSLRTSDRLKALDDDYREGSWAIVGKNIHLFAPSYLTRSQNHDFTDADRVCRVLTGGDVGVVITPQKIVDGPLLPQTVTFNGYAPFLKTKFNMTEANRRIPRPSPLEIVINRDSGNIVERYFIDEVRPEGAVFGIQSVKDLPSLWLGIKLPGRVSEKDNPRIGYFAYRNDTFITGKFPESIILLSDAFSSVKDLSLHNGNPQGVIFWHQFNDNDLTSSVRFENMRRQGKLP